MQHKPEEVAIFLLRIGLGIFLLLWGLDKIFASESTVMVFQVFYFLPINANIALVLGILESILALGIILGMYKTYTYGLGLILHAFSTLTTWKQLITPLWPESPLHCRHPHSLCLLYPLSPQGERHPLDAQQILNRYSYRNFLCKKLFKHSPMRSFSWIRTAIGSENGS